MILFLFHLVTLIRVNILLGKLNQTTYLGTMNSIYSLVPYRIYAKCTTLLCKNANHRMLSRVQIIFSVVTAFFRVSLRFWAKVCLCCHWLQEEQQFELGSLQSACFLLAVSAQLIYINGHLYSGQFNRRIRDSCKLTVEHRLLFFFLFS